MRKTFLLFVLSLAIALGQTDVKGVFSGSRVHVVNPANPNPITPFQPSDKMEPHKELSPADKAAVVARVDLTLRKFAQWGLNPKGVTIESFEVEFVVVKGQFVGGVGVPDKTYLKLTFNPPPPDKPRSGEFDVELIAKWGAYPTAVEALALVEKPKE